MHFAIEKSKKKISHIRYFIYIFTDLELNNTYCFYKIRTVKMCIANFFKLEG